MHPAYHTVGSTTRMAADPLDAAVDSIGFVVHRIRPVGWTIRDVAHPQYDILALALSGRARYECAGQTFDATRGTVLYFPRGVRHSARSDPQAPWSFYSVAFSPICNDVVRHRLNALPSHQKLENVTQLSDWFRQLARMWRSQEQGFSMGCRALVLLLLQQYIAAAHRPRHIPHAQQIEAIVRRLHADVGRVQSVGELAAQAGLSDSRFRLLFRQITGMSVTRYQNQLRIQAARDLMASGQHSVGEVAEELGFRDIYYFSRLFKRFTGAPPSAYRPSR